MGARSKRLCGPIEVPSAGTSTLLYTAPAGTVVLVKSIRIVNTGGTEGRIELGVGGTSASHVILRTPVAAESTYIDPDNDPVVLAAGETIYAQDQRADVALVDLTVTLSGAVLVA